MCLLFYRQLNYQRGVGLIMIVSTAWTSMLYWIVFSGMHLLDIVVPLGGVVMMLEWVAKVVTAFRV